MLHSQHAMIRAYGTSVRGDRFAATEKYGGKEKAFFSPSAVFLSSVIVSRVVGSLSSFICARSPLVASVYEECRACSASNRTET